MLIFLRHNVYEIWDFTTNILVMQEENFLFNENQL
jgi:hypothetical protein